MSLAECINLALTGLRSNKMRSLLTLLGVIIGIAAVITILTLGRALQAQTAAGLANVGANDFTVQIQSRATDAEENPYGPVETIDEDSKITADMIEDLRGRFGDQIVGVSIGDYSSHRGNVTLGGEKSTTSLSAINEDFLDMKGVKLKAGRAFTEEDISGDRQIAIISPETLDALFDGNTNEALGAEVDFAAGNGNTASFTVIGVYESAAQGMLVGADPTSYFYVPWPSEQRIDDEASDAWDGISVRPDESINSDQFKDNLQKYFDGEYADNPDYTAKVTDFSKQLGELNSLLDTISLVVSAIGGISLFVGGIGVMNIMLVTVTERTREIGIRKALGATRRDIRMQFVVESMIVGLIGGMIGVILDTVFGVLGSIMMKSLVYPPINGILVSLIFSLAIGLFFGYHPANKAAKLDPIEALRYE